MSIFNFLKRETKNDNFNKETESKKDNEYSKEQMKAFKELESSINSLLNYITPNLGINGLVNGLTLLSDRIEAAFSHEEKVKFNDICDFIIMKKYYLKPDAEKIKAISEIINEYKMKMPIISNQMSNTEENSIKLKCPKCNVISIMTNEKVYQQWRLIEAGSSITGGVIIHCHSCSFSAPILDWFNNK